jgi:hypothetical protein
MKANIALGKKLHIGLVAALAAFSVAGRVDATVINFDPPSYTAGTTVIGQDYWRWYGSPGGPNPDSIATVVSTASAISSPNVLEVAGSINGAGNYGYLLNTGADGLYNGSTGVITFYYQQVAAPGTYAQSLSFFADDGAYWSVMSFEFGSPQHTPAPGRLGYYNGGPDLTYTSTNVFDASSTGDWFQFTINFSASSYDLNVVNITESATVLDLEGLQFRNGGTITKNVYGAVIMAYDGTSYYDSLSIVAVPEVSSAGLIALGGFGLIFLRRKTLGFQDRI